jgi:hypothetical protein
MSVYTLTARARSFFCTDFVVVALSVSLCVLTASVLFYTGIWFDLSVSLDMTPWREGQDAQLADALVNGTPAQEVPLRCPFYKGEEPEAQCRVCGTVVSRSGLHEVGYALAWHFACTVCCVTEVCRPRTVALTGCSAVLRAQEKVTPLGDLILDWGRATHVCLFMMRFAWLELDRSYAPCNFPGRGAYR